MKRNVLTTGMGIQLRDYFQLYPVYIILTFQKQRLINLNLL
ncbi:MAG: hypothetical protein HLUCCO02_04805 [Idiomarinaceae bacterium HL-53]|nr:MAG: hypothetical protein HLUCCO02_04805 [Idiomarinaceae bacterium HL-53]